jgi:hypothetical protein
MDGAAPSMSTWMSDIAHCKNIISQSVLHSVLLLDNQFHSLINDLQTANNFSQECNDQFIKQLIWCVLAQVSWNHAAIFLITGGFLSCVTNSNN